MALTTAVAFPLRFNLPYTYPPGYDGQTTPCQHDCQQCDRTEAFWRTDPTNLTTFHQTTDATVIVGARYPWGTAVVFASAIATPAQKLAFMETITGRVSANAVHA